MSELNSPEQVLSCRLSKPGEIPYEDSFFGSKGLPQCIPLTTEQIGFVTSVFSIGGLIGSFYIGRVGDVFGRKKASMLYCLVYFIGSILNGLSVNFVTMVIGRFIAGLGAGSALVITPIFINEIAPPDVMGFLGSMNQVSVNVGILYTQLLGLVWSNNNDWRWLLLMGGFIALVDLVLLYFYTDESPRWLYSNGQSSRAFTTLHHLRGGDYSIARSEVNNWGSTGNNEEEGESLLGNNQRQASVNLETYLRSPEFNNSKIVATGILILQQFCGINSIIFYGVSVLVSIFPDLAIMINCMISLVNVVVTYIAANLVDKLGRKPLLLTSVSIMGVSTVLMAFGIIFSNSISIIVGTFTYITFFAIGLGPIPFFIVSEVTQPAAKASAQSWGIAMNWTATFIVGFLFPILKNSWIGGGVYFIFTIMCVFTFGFIKAKIPETKGATSYEQVWNI
ncbi:probable metabolite transport protein [[Candida] jaroonii]|uniref:Probable metabolite transport protein n=1 Tax=[Candida] jaroonii TaxID=467808 RepID=A0ACA9Y415_9ASCO|nr:probable metabolite transport protein [[Candida] jaroonii]